MKKLLVMLFLSVAGTAHADTPATVNLSSWTATTESTGIICAYLDKVIISSSVPAGVFGIYNSTWSNAPGLLISSVSMFTGTNGGKEIDFSNLKVKGGIFYVASGNASPGITVIYKK